MRRTLTNEVILVIAGLLVAAAVIFAFMRSRSSSTPPTAPAGDTQSPPSDAPDTPPAFDWQSLGEQTWDTRCAGCHDQGEGSSRIPPLRAHLITLAESQPGHDYLPAFLLDGRSSAIDVAGQMYQPRHPVYRDRLSDDEIAAVLNHMLSAWGNDALLTAQQPVYLPAAIAQHRAQTRAPDDVAALRPATE